MALSAEQISKYALKKVDKGGSLDDGFVTVGDQNYQIQDYQRQQKEGLDTDQGKTFGTSLEADAKAAGKTFTTFNTSSDIQGALNAITKEKSEEAPTSMDPVQLSKPAAQALAGTDTYEDFMRSGSQTDLIFGGAEGREAANQQFADQYKLNLQRHLTPGASEGSFVGSGGLSGYDNDSQEGIDKPASSAISKKIVGKQAGLKDLKK